MLNHADYQTIRIEARDDGVVIATLNRPEKLNAVNGRMHTELSDFSALVEDDKVVVGSADTVRERVLDLLERTGANHFAAAFAFGSLSHEAAAASMARFAKGVVAPASGSVTTR